jgi:hypothetical protein
LLVGGTIQIVACRSVELRCAHAQRETGSLVVAGIAITGAGVEIGLRPV